MGDPFDLAAGWLQEHLLIPALYQLGVMNWEDVSYGWALFALYGAAQVAVTFAVCLPLERWRPVERWPDSGAVWVDVAYTVLSRVGILPIVTYVLFYRAQVFVSGWMADQGWVPPTLEGVFPFLLGRQVITFVLYAIILDFADYWRHLLSHQFRWWWALHSLHHAQRQMTFWSDDRNHVLDDLIGALWFGVIALLIGVPPLQFPLLVLVLRFVESLAHANVRLSFGWLGERLLISPRFHRAHHGVLAAGQRSCNYGAVFPWWDMVFRTADFSRDYVRTGDPSGEEALHTGGYLQQQWAGLRRLAGAVGGR
jgi:sterol desaturase/sphingolipid hydroxylase (fatty acid hydroxylase superfamily)